MFAETRDEVRSHFLSVWRKMRSREPMQALEQMLAGVIERHPEYHALLSDPERALGTEGDPGAAGMNPFLHMSLHIALAEQLQTDRPPGVVSAYNQLFSSGKFERHALEHRMMDCLAASLWQAQRASTAPDEAAYLACLKRIA